MEDPEHFFGVFQGLIHDHNIDRAIIEGQFVSFHVNGVNPNALLGQFLDIGLVDLNGMQLGLRMHPARNEKIIPMAGAQIQD